MRFTAIVLTLALGYLFVGNQQYIEGLESLPHQQAEVANFAFKAPELTTVSEPVVQMPTEQKSEKTSEPVNPLELLNPPPKESVPLVATATPVEHGDLVCGVLGPIKESRLPSFHTELVELGLENKIFVETIEPEESFGVYSGAYSTEEEAKKRLAFFETKGLVGARVEKSPESSDYSIYLKTFSNEFEARDWSQKAGAYLSIHRLMIKKNNTLQEPMVRLIFNRLTESDYAKLEQFAKHIHEKILNCPEG